MEDHLVGTQLNRYKILECISKSELIGLYKAFDTRLERNVLLKLVLHSSDYSKNSIDFFLNESRSLAKLSHPNISKVLDFGHENGNLFLISEYFSGKALSELMNKPIAWKEAVEILIPITEALAYAHSKGVIHRDLKPENITLVEDDRPVLSDFSLVRIIEGEETRDVTGTNVGLGSPAYISPEQGKGLTVDFRSDIYSLGVIFFEMVTGQKPFTAKTSMEIVIQHVMTAPPRPSSLVPGLPTIIDELILALLSKDVDQRIQTMEEILEKLKFVLQDSPVEVRKQNRFLTPTRAVLITLAFLLAGAAMLYRSNLLSVATPQATATISPTSTQSPTLQATAKIPDSPIPVSSPTPSNVYAIPPLPVLPGTALPGGQTPLDRNNVDQIIELARWGQPAINHFAFIDNDQVLLSSTSAGVYYLDPESLSAQHFFDTKGMLSTFTTSSDEKWVATGDVNGNVAVWNINDGTEIMRFEVNSGSVRSLAFSPDRSRLASAASDKSIYVWDLQKKELLFKLTKHSLPINKIIFTPDSNFIISGGDDFKILVWDAKTGEISNNFSAAKKINDLDISSDGASLVLALNNATVEIWNLPAAQFIDTIKDPKIVSPFTYIKFLPNDQLFLTGSDDGLVRIWSAASSEKIWETPTREVPPPPIQSISVSKNGTRFSVMFEDGLVEIWSISRQAMEFSRQLRTYPVTRSLISTDDRLLAVQGGNSYVEIWSLQTGVQKSVIEGVLPRGDAFSPDGSKILIQSGDLQSYSLTTSVPQYLYKLDNFPQNGSVNYSQDGKIVLASSAGAINFWSMATGRELKPNNLKAERGCKVIFALNGKLLGAGSAVGAVNAEKNVSYFCSVPRGPRTISEDFLPDGSIIALALENSLVEIWDSRTKGDKRTLTSSWSGDMLDVAVSNNGALLASASSSGVIEIYDLETLELITTLNLHAGSVNQVYFSNDGKYIISGTTDGTIRIFGLHP